MKRSFLAAGGSLALLISLLPAAASAAVLELGATSSPLVAPKCPPGVSKDKCYIILTQTTALATSSDSVFYPTTVPLGKPGRIVAYTLGMAKLTKADITTLDATYGGPPEVEMAVLRPGKKRVFTVVSESKPNFIQPWLGGVAQFPLTTTLPVRPGDVLALTVPTWAPVLSINLAARPFQYRASRASGCTLQSTFSTQTAQLTVGSAKPYLCAYGGTRVQYTATEVTSPPVPKGAVK